MFNFEKLRKMVVDKVVTVEANVVLWSAKIATKMTLWIELWIKKMTDVTSELWLLLKCLPFGFCILAIITLMQFPKCGIYNYPAFNISLVEREFYKEVDPNYKFIDNLPECDLWEVLNKTQSSSPWEVAKEIGNFSSAGIVNGSFTPVHCNPQFSVAVIVPYRNRKENLDVFMPYMHNFLRNQNIRYKIYLIEQNDNEVFNKGLLLNIGALIAMKDQIPCLIFHDVDLLPLDAGNLYACLFEPRHMSSAVDAYRFVLPHIHYVGGVMAIRTDQYTEINGFSNKIREWSGDYSDFSDRIRFNRLMTMRLPKEISRYHMMPHGALQPVKYGKYRVSHIDFKTDGLTSIEYTLLQIIQNPLFTHINVTLYDKLEDVIRAVN